MGERKLKVVFETNVLISDLGWSGPPEECLELSIKGDIINFISKPILEELLKVMDYPKFKFTKEEKEQFIELLLSNSIMIEVNQDIEIIEEDPEDNKFIQCALEADADFLISGDSHILDMEKFERVNFVSPKKFIEIIRIES